MQEEEYYEYYRELSKRVERPRYHCECHHHPSHSSIPVSRDGSEPTETTTDHLQEMEPDADSLDIYQTLKHVSVINGSASPQNTEDSSVEGASGSSPENTESHTGPTKYYEKCNPAITFSHVAKAMRHFGAMPEADLKCLKFCNHIIPDISKRGGNKIWNDATLAVYGSSVTMVLESGDHETNVFEVAPDHKDAPAQHCAKSGLRLQFWDGVVMAMEVSKTALPIVTNLIPPSLFTKQIEKFFNR